MAETVRIEIPIETIDNTDPELSNVTRNFERMERAAESANGAAKRQIIQCHSLTGRLERQRRAWQAGQRKIPDCLRSKGQDNANPLHTWKWTEGLCGKNVECYNAGH